MHCYTFWTPSISFYLSMFHNIYFSISRYLSQNSPVCVHVFFKETSSKLNVYGKPDLCDLVSWDMGAWVLTDNTNPQKKPPKSKKTCFIAEAKLTAIRYWKRKKKIFGECIFHLTFLNQNVHTTFTGRDSCHYCLSDLPTFLLLGQFSWIKVTLTFNIPLHETCLACLAYCGTQKWKGISWIWTNCVLVGPWLFSVQLLPWKLKLLLTKHCTCSYVLHCRAALLKRQGSDIPCWYISDINSFAN